MTDVTGPVPVVLEERLDGVIHKITINRPKALNALNAEVIAALDDVLIDLARDETVRAVVLTGAGDKAFVAGADIAEMRGLNVHGAERFAELGYALSERIVHFPTPVIAAVNGFALGGGCELAMMCDIVVAGPGAKFGQPEVKLGVIPGFGGTQRMVRRIGMARAMDLCLTGRTIDADEALAMGIVSRKVDGDVVEAAIGVAREIAAMGPAAVRLCKRAIVENADADMAVGLAAERSLFAMCFATADQTEGMKAFLERRPADFHGH
jgi:enoyl-CoA hydratase